MSAEVLLQLQREDESWRRVFQSRGQSLPPTVHSHSRMAERSEMCNQMDGSLGQAPGSGAMPADRSSRCLRSAAVGTDPASECCQQKHDAPYSKQRCTPRCV